MYFKEGPESLQSVFGSDRKCWSSWMKTVLGLIGVAGFPFQLSPLKTNSIANSSSRFHRSGAKSCQQNICNAWQIFCHKILQHIPTNQAHAHGICWSKNLAKRSKHEILAPTVKLCDILLDAGVWFFSLMPQIRAFYPFHMCFTVRQIFYQMGGIQSTRVC